MLLCPFGVLPQQILVDQAARYITTQQTYLYVKTRPADKVPEEMTIFANMPVAPLYVLRVGSRAVITTCFNLHTLRSVTAATQYALS